MIQIRQAKHSAAVIRLDSLFAHSDGLHAAELDLRQTVWPVQAWRKVGLEDFECYRLISTVMEDSARLSTLQRAKFQN
jgi:hypothetical protein